MGEKLNACEDPQVLAMKLADSCLKVVFLQMKSESSFC